MAQGGGRARSGLIGPRRAGLASTGAAVSLVSRTLGQTAVDMMSAQEFGGFCEAVQTPAGEWLESMALSLTEAADRFIGELRTRRPNDPADRETRALALIEYAVITNEPVPALAALAASLAAQQHWLGATGERNNPPMTLRISGRAAALLMALGSRRLNHSFNHPNA